LTFTIFFHIIPFNPIKFQKLSGILARQVALWEEKVF